MLSYIAGDGADDGDNDQRLMQWGLWWYGDINQIRMFTKNETAWGVWNFVGCLMIKCCQLFEQGIDTQQGYRCFYVHSVLFNHIWRLVKTLRNVLWFGLTPIE